jgi:hypothetical protein
VTGGDIEVDVAAWCELPGSRASTSSVPSLVPNFEELPMRFVPTRIHGVADWLMGALLVMLPWLVDLDRGGPEGLVPLTLGLAALMVTFFTDHELGVVRRIPMVGHLWVDGLAGALLAASPWLFGFADRVWLPHLALGLTEVVAAFVTRLEPADRTLSAAHARV